MPTNPSEIPANAYEWSLVVDADHIDPQNHASNVAVLDWMNQSAWNHSIALGLGATDYQRVGGMFVVRRHEIDYRAQAMLGDDLICVTWIESMVKATAVRRHFVLRADDRSVVAQGRNEWAFIDTVTHRPKRIPAEVLDAFGVTG
jgi:acyl-CoA thioester hydrolase